MRIFTFRKVYLNSGKEYKKYLTIRGCFWMLISYFQKENLSKLIQIRDLAPVLLQVFSDLTKQFL